jgi:hypothetical protein
MTLIFTAPCERQESVDARVPLDRAAQLLSHESVDMTRGYTSPFEEDLQREVEKEVLVQC